MVADDVVFMSDPRAREEYVLNDHGRIWVGSANSNAGRPWNFGQVSGASSFFSSFFFGFLFLFFKIIIIF